MDVLALGFDALPSKELLCFLHEWGLHPSYVKDNGGKVGGKNGGVPSLSPALSQVLSQDEEKDASIDAKDATSSSKVASLADNGRNSAIRNRDKNYIRDSNDSQKDFNSYV